MRTFLLGLVVLGGLNHPAIACDDVCKANEYYSDEAEMCLVLPAT